MAPNHSPKFLAIAHDAKKNVKETTVLDVKSRLDKGEKLLLIDVREEREFATDHIPSAIHLSKGVIERDIELAVPGFATEIILYCGGGFRSALSAENLARMGYSNVISMDGGIRVWRENGFPLTSH